MPEETPSVFIEEYIAVTTQKPIYLNAFETYSETGVCMKFGTSCQVSLVKRLAIATVVILLVLTIFAVHAEAWEYSYESFIEKLGVDVPRERVKGYALNLLLEVNDVRTIEPLETEKYLLLDIDANAEILKIAMPGKPMVPYAVYTFTVKGYVSEAKVRAVPLSYKLMVLDKPIAPAPNPLAYNMFYNNSISYEADEVVYRSERFFPGRLADIKVLHGLLGKSIISVSVYPVQYSPAKNMVLIVDSIALEITYTEPKPLEFSEKSVLIITTPKLVDAVSTTYAKIYRQLGYEVHIVDVNYIYEVAPLAKPITEYPGFYAPAYRDDVYQILVQRYNYTLALKIIGYLSSTLGKYSHVLLIGNAADVPPSFYYQLPLEWLKGYSYDLWIPTDLFYADLDRDLIPDIYVGRIPFSDPSQVQYVAYKIANWYKSPASSSDKLVLVGGYPFLQFPLMFGETALSTMVLANETWSFYVELLTRTSGTYTRENILNVLSGQWNALWLFLISHGTGDSFADYVATEKGIQIEWITARDILALNPSFSIPIVSSVACSNAAWDMDLVPALFTTSVGQATLLSPAGGIAYIGSARMAFEFVDYFRVLNGTVVNAYYGATYLHRKIVSAYNRHRVLDEGATLGQVVSEGIAEYLASVIPMFVYYSEDYYIVLSEVMKLALLGDPVLVLPKPSKVPTKPWIGLVTSPDVATYLDVAIPYYYAQGRLPLFKPGVTNMIEVAGGGTASVDVILVRIFSYPNYLLYHRTLYTTSMSMVEGRGKLGVVFDKEKSGKLLIKFSIPGWGEIRYLATSAALIVQPVRAKAGEPVFVEAFGLDILGYIRYIDLVVSGIIVVSIPVDPVKGYLNWTLALPYLAPGKHKVSIHIAPDYYNPEYTASLTEFIKVFTAEVNVYGEEPMHIDVVAPSLTELRKSVPVLIRALYKGVPTDANISVIVLAPSDAKVPVNINRVDAGLYLATFTATELGIYKVVATATYSSENVYVYGSGGAAVVVVDRVYNIGATLETLGTSLETQRVNVEILAKLLNNTVLPTLGDIVEGVRILNDKTVVIETKLGNLTGQLIEVNNNVLKVNTSLGVLHIDLKDIGANITSNIRDLSEDISKLGGDISRDINLVNSTINRRIDSLSSELDNLKLMVYALLGVSAATLATAGVSIAIRRKS